MTGVKFWAAIGILYTVISCADMALSVWSGAAGIEREPINDLAYTIAREVFHTPTQ